MQTKRSIFLTLSGGALIVALAFVLFAVLQKNLSLLPGINPGQDSDSLLTEPFKKLEQFKTDEEFKEYMTSSRSNQYYGGTMDTFGSVAVNKAAPSGIGRDMMTQAIPEAGGAGEIAQRVSSTNVQVLGIDEPDIVKSDGDTIYYSSPYSFRYYPLRNGGDIPVPMSEPIDSTTVQEKFIVPPEPMPQGGLLSIKSFPPQSMKKLSTLQLSGDLLLARDILVVFNETNYEKRAIEGYDVSDPANPVKKWSIPYGRSTNRIQARLYRNKLYFVSRQDTGSDITCPIRPYESGAADMVIPCTKIYHPTVPVSNDSIYTVSRINPDNGKVEENLSFVASANDSTIYMSKESLYIAYQYQGDLVRIMSKFVGQNTDLFPTSIVQKLAKLKDYDISQQSKMIELTTLLSKLTMGMDEDKRLAFENNINNRMKKFMESSARDLERTGLVKVNVDNFQIDATGDVPGTTLNQFSLDEYSGYLRIATTVGQNSWLTQFGRLTESFSDVYVLDDALQTVGSVKDLGKTERIYSVRFIADRGYVVTFRQTDPFYVLDLSNPSSPRLKGELKIPGYSSYLHPLKEDLLVGIGQENGKIKLSLFNVADPTNPQEIDKYLMSEYWSEALNNHHAFLADEKHEVFFLPGGQGGYVFSYAGNRINMVKAVADTQVQRAVYINDYLYVIGQNKITVWNENNWDKAGELDL